MSLGVAAVVLAATFAIATLALQLVKNSLSSSIAAEQMARVSSLADAIDQVFASRRILLQTFADSVESQDFTDAAQLQTFLALHPSLRLAFDNVAVLDGRGRMVANFTDPAQNGKLNVQDRPYFQQSWKSKQGLISAPFSNRLNGRAQVTITEPVLDAAGEVRFLVSGAVYLQDRSILGTLSDVRFGKTGYLFITTTDGTVVSHPRSALVLGRIPVGENGDGAALQRAVDGLEGTTEGVDDAGVPGLYAFKRIQQTPWIVGAMYPRDEAFARLYDIERAAWLVAVVLSLVAGALALGFVQRRLTPLARLHRHMQLAQADPDATAAGGPQRGYARDEIGDLARTFDELMVQRRSIEQSLALSEARVRTIADNIPALVSHVDASLAYTFVNAHIPALYNDGKPLVGRSMPEVRGADFANVEPYYRRALAGEASIIEKAGDARRGVGDRTYKAHYIPDIDADGVVRGVYAMTFDITDEARVRQALTEQEKRLRNVTDSIPALVGYFDRDERCLYANSRARKLADLGDGPLDGITLHRAVGDAVYAQQLPFIPPVLEGKASSFPVSAPLYGRAGYFQTHLIPDRNLHGEVVGFYLMAFNVTALKEAELQQAESERRLRAITDSMPALITYIDRDERITFANATSRDWLGHEPETVVGRHMRDVAGEAVYQSRRPMVARALAGERVEFEARVQAQGLERVTQVIYVPDTREDGLTHGIFSLALDISALKAVERKLIELARVDTLTGLPNRLAFNEYLPAAVERAREAGGSLALMFLDVDCFKTINDTFGHAVGDAVLVEYARRLGGNVRGTDLAARLAGDEFVLVLEDPGSLEAVGIVASRVVDEVHAPPFVVEGQVIEVTTSVGVAFELFVDGSVTAAGLLAYADAALYNAKAAGRDRFAFFFAGGVGPEAEIGAAMAPMGRSD